LDSLSTRHVFYESVSCAKKVFGQQEETQHSELKPGDNRFTSQSYNIQYFKLDLELPAIYNFYVLFSKSKHFVAFDYFNCQGKTYYTDRPDDINNCGAYYDEDFPNFTAYEPVSPIYISIKYKGKVNINITTYDSIEVTGKTGSIKNYTVGYERFYSYKATTPGYIFIHASVMTRDNDVGIYYDTPGCIRRIDTHLPRPNIYCLGKKGKNNVQLWVPNQDIDRIHYFGLSVRYDDHVQFTYVLFGITEIREGKAEFNFDNSFAMPFKYSAKKGAHNIIVTVSNELVNKCNIYLNYAGCNTKLNVLPNLHNNCLITTVKTHKTCSLNFILEEDVDVYFGVETIISERMTVEIMRNDKLVFLE
jgi:hypothetical protein